MSDKTHRDEFDLPELDDEAFSFPADELTEEELSFAFDEDYAKDVPAPVPAETPGEDDGVPEHAQPAAERGIAAVFRRMVRRDGAGKPGASGARGGKRARGRSKKTDVVYGDSAPVTVGRDLRSDEMLVYDSELDEIDYTDDEDMPEMRDYMPVRFRRYGRVGVGGGIMYALFVISVSIVLACLAWMFAADVLALNKEEHSAVVVIDPYEPGEGEPTVSVVNGEERPIRVDIDQVTTALKNAGIIEYKWLFKLFSRFSHAETKIDPGTYDVTTELDYRAIVTALQFGSGNQEITRITFPEGYTLEQTFTLLEENRICYKADLYEAAANYEFDYDFLDPETLGDANRLEGYLFPDTYDFYQGENASTAINRFLRNFSRRVDDDVKSRAESRGLSLHELLTIASCIEKEAGRDEERATIASIIYNRLDAGWKLQLDSTINYIKNTSTFDLTYADLEIDSPYNTYLYEGLPIGPICSPGLASIEAALNPESTNYWYWYAADGVTSFFTNLDDRDAFMAAHPY